MRKLTIVLGLLALSTWLYPINVVAGSMVETMPSPIIETKNEPVPGIKLPPPQNPNVSGVGDSKPVPKTKSSVLSGRHNTRTEIKINPEVLNKWLSSKGSPLAPYSSQLAESEYWSTIIGICTIEQYGCTKAPYNNYWGLMGNGGLKHFASIEDGISAIDAFLAKGEANHPTIESMRGWYCASACTNWEPTVIKTKLLVESLN